MIRSIPIQKYVLYVQFILYTRLVSTCRGCTLSVESPWRGTADGGTPPIADPAVNRGPGEKKVPMANHKPSAHAPGPRYPGDHYPSLFYQTATSFSGFIAALITQRFIY